MISSFSLPLATVGEALGGLGLFILGMKTMSEGLQRFAGNRFRRLVEKMAGNRLSAAFLGSCLASLLQSGSSAAIIVVGFVNAGLISLYQALGILLGTGVGSTLAVQFIAFQITNFSFPAIFAGVILKFFGKRRKIVYVGDLLLGAGLVFLGLKHMEAGFTPISQSALIQGFSQYVLSWRLAAVLVGAFMTFIVQSSTTATGIVIALAGSGFVTYGDGIAMVIGENLGIAFITLIAAVSGTLAAKRTAFINILITISAIGMTLLLFPVFLKTISFFSPGTFGLLDVVRFSGHQSGELARHIANAHTLFNLLLLIVFLPLIGFFTRSATVIMPGKEGTGDLAPRPKFIDQRVVNTPTLAMVQARSEVRRMADIAGSMYADVLAQLYRFDAKRVGLIRQKEEVLDNLQKEVSAFLILVSRQQLEAEKVHEIPVLITLVNGLENIGDSSLALLEQVQRKKELKIQFSSTAMAEIKKVAAEVEEIVNLACRSVVLQSDDNPLQGKKMLTSVLHLQESLLASHIKRMKAGHCTVEAGLLYGDMLSSFVNTAEHAQTILRTGRENSD